MSNKRHVEIFSAGCSFCQELVEKIQEIACDSCEIDVLDLHREENLEKARGFGINAAPAVAVDGEPVECCQNSGPDVEKLRAAGIGQEVS